MKNLLKFGSFNSDFEYGLNEAKVPVYDEFKFLKSPRNPEPDMVVPTEELVGAIARLLEDQASGKIKMIVVEVDFPTRGKGTPEYLRKELDTERDRLERKEYLTYGSRIEKADRPEDDTKDDINIFSDIEFVVVGIGQKDEMDCVYVVPRSLYAKTLRQPELASQYTLAVMPDQIEEVVYTPTK